MDPPPVQYVKTSDGYDIAYFMSGEGPTVVRTPVLWNHISRQWIADLLGPTYEGLGRYFRMVQYDSRGQGLSTRGVPETVSLTDYMKDLHAVVGTLPPEPFILMGWYYTAKLAIRFAVEHPERVRALVFYDYAEPADGSPAFTQLAEDDWRFFVETIARTGFPGYTPEKVTQVLFDAMTQSDHVRMAKAFRAQSEEDLLPQVKVPMLFMASRTGGRPMAGEEVARKWTAELPNAHMALFEGDRGLFGPRSEGISNAIAVIQQFVQQLPSADDKGGDHQTLGANGLDLSRRQREVLRLLTQGKTNPEIADALSITVNTVQNHLKSIYVKIGAANRAQAAVYARDHGLL